MRLTIDVPDLANANAIINFAHAHNGMLVSMDGSEKSIKKPKAGRGGKYKINKSVPVSLTQDGWPEAVYTVAENFRGGFTRKDIRDSFNVESASDKNGISSAIRYFIGKGVFVEL